jgi:hypothetical protein
MAYSPSASIIRCASTVTVSVLPGAILTIGETTLTVNAELPAPNDGGAADSAVPQVWLGLLDSENATSPPVRMIDSGRNV